MITTESAAFHAARDLRTVQYGGKPEAMDKPVTLLVTGTAAGCRAGHVAALALVEMLARVHRQLRIVAPSVPLLCQTDGTGIDLASTLHATAHSIDPYLDTHRMGMAGELVVRVATDANDDSPAHVVAAWHGGRGEVHVHGIPPAAPANLDIGEVVHDPDGDVLGAATAACLAAAAAFRLAHGDAARPAALNLLERTSDDQAGPTSLDGPVDVGDVLVVGAGALGHGALYWLREFGTTGQWEVVDADPAEIHNTGRCLGMTAADAGWPRGLPGGPVRAKVHSAAALIEAMPHEKWFHELDYTNQSRRDLLLPLANEHGIRAEVAQLGEELLLHASTSQHWTAELHRHIAGRDDCPACRIPDTHEPALLCATGPARPDEAGSPDAALPFLSATAGLLLVAALLDLGSSATVLVGRVNHWRVSLELGGRLWQKLPHDGFRCAHVLAPAVRDSLHRNSPRRWDELPSDAVEDRDSEQP